MKLISKKKKKKNQPQWLLSKLTRLWLLYLICLKQEFCRQTILLQLRDTLEKASHAYVLKKEKRTDIQLFLFFFISHLAKAAEL